MNLIGITDAARVWNELFMDSFHLASFMDGLFGHGGEDFSVWDLGAGAGLPGIPLRILWQKGSYVMVEARQKRALFLKNALAALQLPRVQVFSGRAEKFFSQQESAADCIVSRAFMPQSQLLDFCRPHLSTGGRLILLTNAPVCGKDGWFLETFREYTVKGQNRFLSCLKKMEAPDALS